MPLAAGGGPGSSTVMGNQRDPRSGMLGETADDARLRQLLRPPNQPLLGGAAGGGFSLADEAALAQRNMQLESLARQRETASSLLDRLNTSSGAAAGVGPTFPGLATASAPELAAAGGLPAGLALGSGSPLMRARQAATMNTVRDHPARMKKCLFSVRRRFF